MTAPAPEREAPPGAKPAGEDERDSFTYQGSRVPLLVILLWAAFFIWAIAYLLRWIPESWMEWFSR